MPSSPVSVKNNDENFMVTIFVVVPPPPPPLYYSLSPHTPHPSAEPRKSTRWLAVNSISGVWSLAQYLGTWLFICSMPSVVLEWNRHCVLKILCAMSGPYISPHNVEVKCTCILHHSVVHTDADLMPFWCSGASYDRGHYFIWQLVLLFTLDDFACWQVVQHVNAVPLSHKSLCL
jgi:hypothetical protein